MAYGRVSRSTPPPFRPAAVRLNPAEKADQARIAKVVAEARHRERIERIERMQSLSRSRPGAATGASARSHPPSPRTLVKSMDIDLLSPSCDPNETSAHLAQKPRCSDLGFCGETGVLQGD